MVFISRDVFRALPQQTECLEEAKHNRDILMAYSEKCTNFEEKIQFRVRIFITSIQNILGYLKDNNAAVHSFGSEIF